jgi:hypothetical protein
MNAEMIVAVTAPVGLHATVRGSHVPVVALSVVRITAYVDGDEETFDVIKAVVAGAASEAEKETPGPKEENSQSVSQSVARVVVTTELPRGSDVTRDSRDGETSPKRPSRKPKARPAVDPPSEGRKTADDPQSEGQESEGRAETAPRVRSGGVSLAPTEALSAALSAPMSWEEAEARRLAGQP